MKKNKKNKKAKWPLLDRQLGHFVRLFNEI